MRADEISAPLNVCQVCHEGGVCSSAVWTSMLDWVVVRMGRGKERFIKSMGRECLEDFVSSASSSIQQGKKILYG